MLELLAPAGDFEKLKIALRYGADAVYFGGKSGSLRAAAGNLSIDEIRKAVDLTHEENKKAYMTLNIYAHNDDIPVLDEYLKQIRDIPIDAFIISDPGIIYLIREVNPDAIVHLSTQASTTNSLAAKFWYEQGIKRLILARELTLTEIKEIKDSIPDDMELEVFVHGAMCISYSGRCLLSNALNHRDSNRGDCSQPCRWKYSLMEEQRPGEYLPVEEDSRGTYILNSKDLCMIEHIPELFDAGINSLKIEGRMKSAYYLATVVNAYRDAIDNGFKQIHMEELLKASHREFGTGFFFDKPNEKPENAQTSMIPGYIRGDTFLGIVKEYDNETGIATIEQRNKVCTGDRIEIFGPGMKHFIQTVDRIWDENMKEIADTPHAQQIYHIVTANPVKTNDLLRLKEHADT